LRRRCGGGSKAESMATVRQRRQGSPSEIQPLTEAPPQRRKPLPPEKFRGLNSRGLKVLTAVMFVAPAAMTAAVTNFESGAIILGFTVVLFFMTQSF